MAIEIYPLDEIIPIARERLSQRAGAVALLDQVEADPVPLTNVLASIDAAIEGYNDLPADKLPRFLTHTARAKLALPGLPKIQELLAHPDPNLRSMVCTSYRFALHSMNTLMERAEQGEGEPNLAFHIWDGATPEERLTGGALWAYGLATAELGHQAYDQPAATLLDSLLEVAALDRDQHADGPLFTTALNREWYTAASAGHDFVFTPEIRDLALGYRI